jgi:hypothetical protein
VLRKEWIPMPHFSSPPRRQVEDLDHVHPVAAAACDGQSPERIPGFIDALDCLLALWIAEAKLDSGAEEGAAADPLRDSGGRGVGCP